MAKSKELNMKIPTVGDLFSTQEERDEVGRESVRDIPLEDIHEFPNHPFKVKMDDKMKLDAMKRQAGRPSKNSVQWHRI